jgi:hypothetical protein
MILVLMIIIINLTGWIKAEICLKMNRRMEDERQELSHQRTLDPRTPATLVARTLTWSNRTPLKTKTKEQTWGEEHTKKH